MPNSYNDAVKYQAQETALNRAVGQLGVPYHQPIAERLTEQRNSHEAQIAKIDRTLELLSKNPDIEELLNLTRTLL